MDEALQVIKALWTGESVSFSGDHYRIEGLVGTPIPVQRPLPVFVGGGGEDALARRPPRHIVGLNPTMSTGRIDASIGSGALEATERKLALQPPPGTASISSTSTPAHLAMVTDDRMSIAEALAGGFGLTVDDALHSPHALVGTVEQLVDNLVERRERFGISDRPAARRMDQMAPVVARLANT